MMQNLDRFQGPGSGLAHALGETTPRFPSLAQNLRRNPQSNLAPRYNNGAKTRSEQQAITILLGQHDDDIFAYLRFARSLSQNAHYSLGHGPLSEDQVRAVWALRGYADDKIRAWLDQARKLGETVGYALELQELTPTSKWLRTTPKPSRRFPSRTWLRVPLLIRAGTRNCAWSWRYHICPCIAQPRSDRRLLSKHAERFQRSSAMESWQDPHFTRRNKGNQILLVHNVRRPSPIQKSLGLEETWKGARGNIFLYAYGPIGRDWGRFQVYPLQNFEPKRRPSCRARHSHMWKRNPRLVFLQEKGRLSRTSYETSRRARESSGRSHST